MTYQVLARKLRPADFSALVGQDHVVQALSHALDNDRLHHAYLFTGTRGVGKTTIARILARCLNCEQGVSSTPCGECPTCQAITEGRFVDLIEMDGASQNKVENVHDLQDGAQYMPNSGRFKVYLIDEVHMLSKSAFNALLKILEEPPAHVKFLLATTEVNKLPITILSRCLQFQLKNMTVDRISSYLAQALTAEEVPYDTGALRIIGTAAAGSMRDALSVTDQAISFGAGKLEEAQVAQMLGVTGRDEITAILQALASADAAKVLACAGELAERGVDFGAVLADMLRAFHDIAVAQMLPVGAAADSSGADGEAATGDGGIERATDLVADSVGAGFVSHFAPDVVQLFYQIALRSHRDLAMSPDPQIGFEMALLRMLAFAPADINQSVPPLTSPAAQGGDGSGENGGGAAPASGSGDDSTASEAAGVVAAQQPSAAQALSPANAQTRSEAQAGSEHGQRVNALIQSKSKPQPVALPAAPDSFWYELQAQIGAQAVIGMIMRNCVLLNRDHAPKADAAAPAKEEHWHLQLDPAHDGMLSDRHPQQIASLVSEATGQKVTIKLTVGTPDWETPGMQLTRERKERQAEAVETMRSSAMVQSLLSTFGARLDEESIRPLDAEGNPVVRH